jgi:hypothetical protein
MALLAEMGRVYPPLLLANADAIAAGAQSLETVIDGQAWSYRGGISPEHRSLRQRMRARWTLETSTLETSTRVSTPGATMRAPWTQASTRVCQSTPGRCSAFASWRPTSPPATTRTTTCPRATWRRARAFA